jgi:hypothetical protein
MGVGRMLYTYKINLLGFFCAGGCFCRRVGCRGGRPGEGKKNCSGVFIRWAR